MPKNEPTTLKRKVHFICTFDNYDKEKDGRKRNHVVKFSSLLTKRQKHKFDELIPVITGIGKCRIILHRGYTPQYFWRDLTDVTIFENRVIMSW